MNLLRRKFPRFKINASAQLVAQGAEQAVLKLIDVSVQGIRGVTAHKLNVNGEVEILLDAPAVKRPVSKKARVVWTRPTDNDQCEAGFSIQHVELDNFSDQMFLRHRDTFPSFSVYEMPEQQDIHAAAPVSSGQPWDKRDSVIVLVSLALIIGGFWKTPAAGWFKNMGGSAASVASRVFSNLGRQGFNLEGVVYEPDGLKYITVNGQIVGEGENIDNVLVKSISADAVLLERNGRDERISVP